jgi:hypothetical protein
MPATKTKQPRLGRHGSRTKKRGKWAKARVKSGHTYRTLRALGFGMQTIRDADDGRLPKHPAIRASYLTAIGCPPEVKS